MGEPARKIDLPGRMITRGFVDRQKRAPYLPRVAESHVLIRPMIPTGHGASRAIIDCDSFSKLGVYTKGAPEGFNLPKAISEMFLPGTVIIFHPVADSEAQGRIHMHSENERLFILHHSENAVNAELYDAIERAGRRNLAFLEIVLRDFYHDFGNRLNVASLTMTAISLNCPELKQSLSSISGSLIGISRRSVEATLSLLGALNGLSFRSSIAATRSAILEFRSQCKEEYFKALDVLIKNETEPACIKRLTDKFAPTFDFIDSVMGFIDSPNINISPLDLAKALKQMLTGKGQYSPNPLAGSVSIKANPYLLKSLINNFCENADRASGAQRSSLCGFEIIDGVAIVRIENKVNDPQMRDSLESGGFLDFVPDPKDRTKSIQRMFLDRITSRASGEGGHGLAICYDIVALFGGQIEASYDSGSDMFTMTMGFPIIEN